VEPLLDPQALLAQAERDPGFFCARVKPSRHDQALWDITLQEVADGKTLGPFDTLDELSRATGGHPVVALRFGVLQSGCLRPCDDFTAEILERFHVNACYASSRKLRLSDLSVLGPWAARLAASGRRCALWKRDHKSAYRQIPIRRSHRRFAAFSFCCPSSGKRKYFCPVALPFGATASVYAYNRVAAALTFLANRALRVPVSNFFDDYWSLDGSELAESGFAGFGLLNELLNFSLKLPKDLPPCPAGELLGAWVDAAASPLRLCITPARRAGLMCDLASILDNGVLGGGQAKKLAGRLSFALFALFGRVGRAALAAVFRRATRNDGPTLSAGLRAALVHLAAVLRLAPPSAFFGAAAKFLGCLHRRQHPTPRFPWGRGVWRGSHWWRSPQCCSLLLHPSAWCRSCRPALPPKPDRPV